MTRPRIVPRPARKRGRPPTMDLDRLVEMYNRGLSEAEIATALGCTPRWVRMTADRLIREQEETEREVGQ